LASGDEDKKTLQGAGGNEVIAQLLAIEFDLWAVGLTSVFQSITRSIVPVAEQQSTEVSRDPSGSVQPTTRANPNLSNSAAFTNPVSAKRTR